MKKTHLLVRPMRVQDIDFDNLDDDLSQKSYARVERSRVASYRKLRHQES